MNWYQIMGTMGPFLRPRCIGTVKGSNPIAIKSTQEGKCSHLMPLLRVSEGVSVRQMRLDTQNTVITLFFVL